VTNDGDRRKALAWDVEILVNNAGVGVNSPDLAILARTDVARMPPCRVMTSRAGML
jgi:short-subunit dehydrogenase